MRLYSFLTLALIFSFSNVVFASEIKMADVKGSLATAYNDVKDLVKSKVDSKSIEAKLGDLIKKHSVEELRMLLSALRNDRKELKGGAPISVLLEDEIYLMILKSTTEKELSEKKITDDTLAAHEAQLSAQEIFDFQIESLTSESKIHNGTWAPNPETKSGREEISKRAKLNRELTKAAEDKKPK